MEIADLLRSRRAWLTALLVVPLMAVLVTALVTVREPSRWQVSTRFRATAPTADNSPISDRQTAQRVARAVTSPEVVNEVASRFGVSPAEAEENLTAARNDAEVNITFSAARSADGAVAALDAIVQAGLASGYAADVDRLQANVDRARVSADAAKQSLAGFEGANNIPDGWNRYRRLSQERTDLRAQREAAVAAGDRTRQQQLQQAIDFANLELGPLEPLSSELQRLGGEVTRTTTQQSSAQSRVDAVTARRDGLAANARRDASRPRVVSTVAVIARRAAVAGAVGLLFAALGVLLASIGQGSIPDRGRRRLADDERQVVPVGRQPAT